MDTVMVELQDIRLFQLISPSLPTGAFSYSQGLEWVVEAGWVGDSDSLYRWLLDMLESSLCFVDLPLLKQMMLCCEKKDIAGFDSCCDTLLACRESQEMQLEEMNRGRAMATLLDNLELIADQQWKKILAKSQLGGFGFGASLWGITVEKAAAGYLWSWLENQVVAGVKIIPLGQTEGQDLLRRLGETIPTILAIGLQLDSDEVGGSSPALALASSLHETQYTRIYRS